MLAHRGVNITALRISRLLPVILLLLLAGNQHHLYAQNIGYVLLQGKVYINDKPIEKVNIKIFLRDKQVNHVRSAADGSFEVNLPFNEKYRVEIGKFGLVTKRFIINTELPNGEREDQVYTFNLSLDLFPPFEEVDMRLLDNPEAYIAFDTDLGIFAFNFEEATETIRKVKLLEKQIYAVLEVKAKLFKAEMENAQIAYSKRNFVLARGDFKKALAVYPVNTAKLYIDVDSIKGRISEIDKLLNDMDVAQKAKIRKKALDDAMMMATKASLDKRLDDALLNYYKVLEINPKDSVVKAKIEKIKKSLTGETILTLVAKNTAVENGTEVRMRFLPIKQQLKRGNYLYIRVKNKGEENARLNIRYGTDADMAGNFVINDLSGTDFKEHYIKLSSSERWSKWNINWISLFPDGGDIEVLEMKIIRTE